MVDAALPLEVRDHRQGDGGVGPRVDRQVHVAHPVAHDAARVDDGDARPRRVRPLEVRHEVDVAVAGVGAPDQDEARRLEICHVDRRELAVHRLRHRPGGSGADGGVEARGAELPEESCVGRSHGEEAVRPAVVIRKDRLPAALFARGADARRDGVERLVPGDPLERSAPLGAGAPQRMEQPVRAVEPLGEPAHLAADEAVGHRIDAAAFDAGDAPLLDTHVEAAPVGTVEGTGGVKVGRHARNYSIHRGAKRVAG